MSPSSASESRELTTEPPTVTASRDPRAPSAVDARPSHQPLTITVEQAGQLLGISRGLAYELVRRGEIPAIRLGRRLVVPVDAIDAMLHDPSLRTA
jgi:excisionase family DNA binding protein